MTMGRNPPLGFAMPPIVASVMAQARRGSYVLERARNSHQRSSAISVGKREASLRRYAPLQPSGPAAAPAR